MEASGRSRPARRRTVLAVVAAAALVALGRSDARAAGGNWTVPCSGSGGGTAGLIARINDANTGGGANTINLAAGCTYTLTAVNNSTANGANGLPLITSDLTINGNGATIARDTAGGTPDFGLFEVDGVGAALRLNAVTLSGGVAFSSGIGTGGAVALYSGVVTATNSSFANNSAAYGGAIYVSGGTLTITGGSFTNNIATAGHGGAVASFTFFGSPTISISGSTFSGNTAASDGGAVGLYGGVATVTTTTFNGNNGGFAGGALSVQSGSLTLKQSTLSGNAAMSGGGISVSGGAATAANVTVVDNHAGLSNGGGVAVSGGTATFKNATFGSNTAEASAGSSAHQSGGSLSFANSILAQQLGSTTTNCGGTIGNGGQSLQWPVGGGCGSIAAADPKLNPAGAAANGGPTATIALMTGSAAIDTGAAAVCTSAEVAGIDQRGVTRDATCDIGAYETGGVGLPDLFRVSATANGSVATAWTDTNGETGYYLVHSLDSGASYAFTALSANTSTHTLSGLPTGATAYLWLTACIGSVCTPYVGAVVGVAVAPPGTPGGFQRTAATNSSVTVSWTASANASAYQVAWSTDLVNYTVADLSGSATSYTIGGSLAANTPVYAWVRACNAAGCSSFAGALITATGGAVTPAVPGNLRGGTVTGTSLQLLWDDVANETFYYVAYSTNSGATWQFAQTSANVTSWTLSALAPGQRVYFAVNACNGSATNCSAFSAALSLTTSGGDAPLGGRGGNRPAATDTVPSPTAGPASSRSVPAPANVAPPARTGNGSGRAAAVDTAPRTPPLPAGMTTGVPTTGRTSGPAATPTPTPAPRRGGGR